MRSRRKSLMLAATLVTGLPVAGVAQQCVLPDGIRAIVADGCAS